MKTTSLFVELLVTGLGAQVWIILGAMALFGIEPGFIQSSPTWMAMPLLGTAYVLGIVTDRMADILGEVLGESSLMKRYFSDKDEYVHDQNLVYASSPSLASILEYSRSRLRICRGWTLNTPLIGLTALFFLQQHRASLDRPVLTMVAVGAASALFTLMLWFSYRRIARAEFNKVKLQAAYLREKADQH